MKKYLFLICLWAFLPLFAGAQTGDITLNGIVKTADGQAASGLLVWVNGQKQIAYTTNDGSFRIQVPQDARELMIKSGVNSSSHPIHIKAGATAVDIGTITLEERTHELNEVVVTGQYEAQSLKNSVQKVRTISNELIRLRGAVNVMDVLSTALGVRFSNDLTLGETDIQIMGMSGQNVKVLLDGVPLVDRGGTKQSLSQIDINTIDRIEIVEGPMSVVYGTDALAGVVNLITKKSNGQARLNVAARVQEETVGSEYQGFSNNGIHMQNLAVTYADKGWEYHAGGTRNNNGGWQGNLTGRTKQWRPKTQNMANGRVAFRNSQLYAWYRVDFLDEEISALGNINPNNNRTTDAFYITKRFTHQLQTEWKVNPKLSLNAAASYQDYTRETLTTDVDFNTGKTTLNLNQGTQDMSGFKTAFLRSTLQYQWSPMISIQPGIDIKLDEANGQRILNNPSIGDYSAFVTSEIKVKSSGFFNQVTFKPGLRFSLNSVYDAPPVIPSLNTLVALGKSASLRLGYARGFRSPALRELYFTFHDASHDIEGNENLKAEYSHSYTGSISWQSINHAKVQLSSTISAFYNDFRNRIGIATGVDPLNPQWSIYVNIDRYKTAGGTIENQLFWGNFQADLGFSLVGRYNRYSETFSDLSTFMFTPELNSHLIYRFNRIGLQSSLSYKMSGKRPGYEYASGTLRETEVDSFSWADIGLHKKLTRYATLNAGVKNLFNVTSIKNSSQDVGGAHSTGGAIPMGYGRSYFFGLTMQWNKN